MIFDDGMNESDKLNLPHFFPLTYRLTLIVASYCNTLSHVTVVITSVGVTALKYIVFIPITYHLNTKTMLMKIITPIKDVTVTVNVDNWSFYRITGHCI